MAPVSTPTPSWTPLRPAPARLALGLAGPLVLVALAGCSGTGTDASSTTTGTTTLTVAPAGPVELKAMTPQLLGKGAGEPSIAVGPGGAVYVADPFMTIWRSNDDGASYVQAASKGMEGGGDGDLVVDGAGTLHWLGLGGSAAPIPYQASTDGGESFGQSTDLSDGKGFDREWIDVTADGRLYTSWRDDRGLVVRTSPDLGATWEEVVSIHEDTLAGPIVHDPSADRVFLPFVADGKVSVGIGIEHATKWTLVDVAPLGGGGLLGSGTNIFPAAAVDDSGNLYVAWSTDSGAAPMTGQEQATRYGVFLTVSTDHGATFAAPRLISDPAVSAIMPWIAGGADGRIAVVWYEGLDPTAANEALPTSWNVRLWESLDATQAAGPAQSILLNRDPVHFGLLCGGGRCTTGSDRSALDFFEVAINGAGQPVVTWVSSLPFQYPASVVVPGFGVDIYAGGLSGGPRLR